MAITGNGCFGSHGGCERPHHCNIPSSNIFYDGETIEEAKIRLKNNTKKEDK